MAVLPDVSVKTSPPPATERPRPGLAPAPCQPRSPSAVEHPNSREARRLRRAEIEHAMRCLYRDPKWIGDVPVSVWLARIHYLNSPRYKGIIRDWCREARVDPLCPVDELAVDQRDRLIWTLLRALRDGRIK